MIVFQSDRSRFRPVSGRDPISGCGEPASGCGGSQLALAGARGSTGLALSQHDAHVQRPHRPPCSTQHGLSRQSMQKMGAPTDGAAPRLDRCCSHSAIPMEATDEDDRVCG
jgi:hypothetical protein